MKHPLTPSDIILQVEALFEAIRFDWLDAHSSLLQENFVIYLN